MPEFGYLDFMTRVKMNVTNMNTAIVRKANMLFRVKSNAYPTNIGPRATPIFRQVFSTAKPSPPFPTPRISSGRANTAGERNEADKPRIEAKNR